MMGVLTIVLSVSAGIGWAFLAARRGNPRRT